MRAAQRRLTRIGDEPGRLSLPLRAAGADLKIPIRHWEHREALRKLFDGPRHAITGERIFHGIPFGSCFDVARGHLYLFRCVLGAGKDLMKLDFGKDMDTYTAALGPYLNAENADLGPFEKEWRQDDHNLAFGGFVRTVPRYSGLLRTRGQPFRVD